MAVARDELDARDARRIGVLAVIGIDDDRAPLATVNVLANPHLEALAVELVGNIMVDAAREERLGVAVAVDEAAVERNHVRALHEGLVDSGKVAHDGRVGTARGGHKEHARLAHEPQRLDVRRRNAVLRAEKRLVHVGCNELVHESPFHAVV